MVDQTGSARLSALGSGGPAAEETAGDRTSLDQAAADGSITQARYRAVDPVPIVTEGPAVATLDSVDQRPLGVRRRLSPRPVPGNRRKKTPQVADEEPTPAEEMDDVSTQDDKAAKATESDQATQPADNADAAADSSRGVTATKTKPKTAAEIVAAQKAREAEAATAGPKDDETAVTKPVTRQPAATGASATGASGNNAGENPLAAARAARESSSPGKGRAAMSTMGSGVKRVRNLVASLVWLIAVLAAAVLALGALFTALDQANQSNEIVRWVLERGHDLVGPFKDLFRLETAKNTLLVNWGIAALVYLIVGKIIERFVRP
ncbi:hypothetical protein [Kribbella sp. DT2]|uniref:hypothetical protein n=1 Tax=Kribbella sp. DT2 TaxID=3393427 RepID=UPI003CE92059